MTVSFGVHLGSEPVDPALLVSLWGEIDELGFDWISVWDHFVPSLTDLGGAYEAVAAHTALAMSTSTATCGALVYSITHRHPAVLANAIATIDRFSGGRAALGIGIGWSVDEHRMYGIGLAPPGERFDALEEWLPCLRRLFDGETVSFDGRHVHLDEARLVPGPRQDHLPIWVGGGGETRTIPLAARFADGWNSPAGLSPEEFGHKVTVLRSHCGERRVRAAANVLLPWTEENLAIIGSPIPGALLGSEDDVVPRVLEYIEAGADQVNFSYLPQWGADGLRRAASVVDAVRARLS